MIMKKYPAIIKKFSSLLHDWDPIGMTPPDEYDDLSIKLYNQIAAGNSKEELVNFTVNYLRNHVGLSEVDKADAAASLSLILHEYINAKE